MILWLILWKIPGQVFSAPPSYSRPARRPQGKECARCMGPTLHPVGRPGHPSVAGKNSAFAKLEVLPHPPSSC